MSKVVNTELFFALDYLPEGYFIIDENYKVIYWNKPIENLTGIDKKEILNYLLFEIFPNFNKELYKLRINPVFKGGPPVVFSAKLHKNLFSRNNTDSDLYYQLTISSLRIGENKYNALFAIENRSEVYSQINELISLRDKALDEINEKDKTHTKLISQHIEIQEAFAAVSEKNHEIEKQKQQLQELVATKDKFFTILAHDLINPFSLLLGYTSLLSEKIESYSIIETKEMINLLNKTTQQTYDLLQNLLQWAKSQTGKIIMQPEILKIKSIIESNIALLKSNIDHKSIHVENNVQDGSFVFADENMLNTVVRNLLSNAIKFTQKNGRITFDTVTDKNDKTNKNEQKGFVTVCISDTGVGINREKLSTLFKVEKSSTTIGTDKEKGTGLGLILCNEFVEKMGGKMSVESEVGKGSKFFFTLPRYSE
jgi:PAS domain S-box-containing protein